MQPAYADDDQLYALMAHLRENYHEGFSSEEIVMRVLDCLRFEEEDEPDLGFGGLDESLGLGGCAEEDDEPGCFDRVRSLRRLRRCARPPTVRAQRDEQKRPAPKVPSCVLMHVSHFF